MTPPSKALIVVNITVPYRMFGLSPSSSFEGAIELESCINARDRVRIARLFPGQEVSADDIIFKVQGAPATTVFGQVDLFGARWRWHEISLVDSVTTSLAWEAQVIEIIKFLQDDLTYGFGTTVEIVDTTYGLPLAG